MTALEKLPPPLSWDREQDLLASDRTSLQVRDELLMSTLRECVVYGGTCCQWALNVSELISICTTALCKSIRNYNIKKAGTPPMRLISYSKPYIRGEIMRELSFRKEAHVAPQEVIEDIQETLAGHTPTSRTFEEMVPPEMDLIHIHEQWEIVKPFLAELTETERRVLILSEEGEFSLAEIGRMTGYTRENIRVTRQRALRKIRNSMISKKLYYETR